MNMGDREENSILQDLNFSYNHDMDDAQLPPGFMFHPTDEEIITHYLIRKVLDKNFIGRAIVEVDLKSVSLMEGSIPSFIIHYVYNPTHPFDLE